MLSRFLYCLYIVLFLQCNAFAGDGACHGIWSANSLSLDDSELSKPLVAPNGAYSIIALDGNLAIVDKQQQKRWLNIPTTPSLTEVVWSPDSEHFVVNYSDGGVVGTWSSKVYSVHNENFLSMENAFKDVMPIARKLPLCNSIEDVNYGVISWLNNKEFLVVIEVPPHSSCKNMGSIAGFRVQIESGKITQHISAKLLRTKWKPKLGCRFQK